MKKRLRIIGGNSLIRPVKGRQYYPRGKAHKGGRCAGNHKRVFLKGDPEGVFAPLPDKDADRISVERYYWGLRAKMCHVPIGGLSGEVNSGGGRLELSLTPRGRRPR